MITRIRVWLSVPEFLLFLVLRRMGRGWACMEFTPLIHSGSCILAANNVPATRRASCRKGIHENAQRPVGGFLAEIPRNNVSKLRAGAA